MNEHSFIFKKSAQLNSINFMVCQEFFSSLSNDRGESSGR